MLVAWGDPPKVVGDSYNPYDPQDEKQEDEIQMELKYMVQLIIFLGQAQFAHSQLV